VSLVRDRTGKMKITSILLLLVIVAGAYVAYAFGGVYMRRYRLNDALDDQLSFAGEIADETIRAQLVNKIAGMHLPPAASRVRMSRSGARTIQVTVAYTETVNLLFTKKDIPVSITRRRTY